MYSNVNIKTLKKHTCYNVGVDYGEPIHIDDRFCVLATSAAAPLNTTDDTRDAKETATKHDATGDDAAQTTYPATSYDDTGTNAGKNDGAVGIDEPKSEGTVAASLASPAKIHDDTGTAAGKNDAAPGIDDPQSDATHPANH